MEIRQGSFYKVKETATAEGKAVQTPGGYFYVAGAGNGKVAVITCEREELPKEAGAFVISEADFKRITEG